MDIFRLLLRDHASTRSSLADWTRHPGGASGAALWAKWTNLWDVHVRVEENFLFPFLTDETVLRPLMSQAVDAHALIRKNIRELPEILCGTRAWVLAVQELSRTLMLSFELEENRLYPLARKVLAPEEAKELGREVQEFLRGLRLALATDR